MLIVWGSHLPPTPEETKKKTISSRRLVFQLLAARASRNGIGSECVKRDLGDTAKEENVCVPPHPHDLTIIFGDGVVDFQDQTPCRSAVKDEGRSEYVAKVEDTLPRDGVQGDPV